MQEPKRSVDPWEIMSKRTYTTKKFRGFFCWLHFKSFHFLNAIHCIQFVRVKHCPAKKMLSVPFGLILIFCDFYQTNHCDIDYMNEKFKMQSDNCMNFVTSSFTLSVLPVTIKVGGILVQESRNTFFFFSKPVVKARSAISSTNLHRCLILNALDICVSFHPKIRKKISQLVSK